MDLLQQAREWQRIKQAMALEHAGTDDGDQALADSKKIRVLADEIERLRLFGDEPMRVIAVEAIREVTGCPDIYANGKYLVDVLMKKMRDFVQANA